MAALTLLLLVVVTVKNRGSK